MGFYPPDFSNDRDFQQIASKQLERRNLASSGCSSSFPVVTGTRVHGPGQNRDKIFLKPCSLIAIVATLFFAIAACAVAHRDRRRPLIYTRYSSDLQSDKSNEDQEREVRLLFRRKGIDATNAYIIHDRAESATTNDRPGFNEAVDLVRQGLVSDFGVDDQARASRNDEVISVVKDLVFRGVRFISGDGVDTSERGWENKVRLLSIHNAISTEEKARLVRRGMKGRVLDNKSAGDFPFGYESFFDDPEYAANWCGRGPKPTKSIRIFEPLAKWVRQIFEWVADGVSFSKIAKKLQEEKVPVGRNIKRWNSKAVSRTVRNVKYTGEKWIWGATMTIRDSQGNKKQVPAPDDDVACVSRPDLRIVDADLWERAQQQVARIDEIFGFKEGQKKRGAKVHFTQVYPTNILFTLLRCGECGGEMHYNASRGREYRQCKNSGLGPDDCRVKTRVPANEAKKVLTEFAANLLSSVPNWLRTAIDRMNDAVRKQQLQLPARVEQLRQQQTDFVNRRTRLFELVETGDWKNATPPNPLGSTNVTRSSIRERLDELDREIDNIAATIAECELQLTSSVALPDHDFIVSQIETLPSVFRTDESKAGQLLGELFDVVRVCRVTPPGKQRGYHQLKFHLKAWRIIRAALGGAAYAGNVCCSCFD